MKLNGFLILYLMLLLIFIFAMIGEIHNRVVRRDCKNEFPFDPFKAGECLEQRSW